MGPIDGKSYDIDIGNGLYTFSWRPPNRIIEQERDTIESMTIFISERVNLGQNIGHIWLRISQSIYIPHIISNVNSMHSFELGRPCF